MLKQYLYKEILNHINEIAEDDVYAISILVECNNCYKGFENFPSIVMLYNTEKDCDNAPECSEERWNIAEWYNSEEFFLADEDECVDGTEVLYQWFVSQGISEIREDESSMYDDDMNYIGKGPTGYYDLCCEIAEVVNQIQNEDIIRDKFKNIPILIVDYDYSWYIVDFVKIANTNGQAEKFFEYYKNEFND